jgi:methyl-accepting chemotaxis protein
MSFFNDLKIGRRLGLGFGIQMLLMTIILVIGIYNITRIKTTVEQIVQVVNRKAELTATISNAIDNVYLDMAEMLMSNDPKEIIENKRRIDNKRGEYKKAMEELVKIETFDEGKKLIATLQNQIVQARDSNNRILELVMAGKQEKALASYHNGVKSNHDEVLKSIEELSAYQHKRFTVRFEEAASYIVSTRSELLLAGLVSLIFSIGLGILTTLSITRPVALGMMFANRMAEGDLTHTLEIEQKDELGTLATVRWTP